MQELDRRTFLALAANASVLGWSTQAVAQETETGTAQGTETDAESDSWPEEGFDAQNTSYNPAATGPRNRPEEEPHWTFSHDPAAEGGDMFADKAVAHDGVVFTTPKDGEAVAIDIASGQPIWTGPNAHDVGNTMGIADDTLYLFDGGGHLHAYDTEDLSKIYERTYEEVEERENFDFWGSPPIFDDENGLYTHYATRDGHIWAGFDRDTGRMRWSRTTYSGYANLDGTRGNPAFYDGVFYAYRPSGDEFGGPNQRSIRGWDGESGEEVFRLTDADLGEERFISSIRAVVDGVMLFYWYDRETTPATYFMSAYDVEDEVRLWKTAEPPAGQRAGEEGVSPAVADGTVYVPTDDGGMRALDLITGEEEWSNRQLDVLEGKEISEVGDGYADVGRPVVADNAVYAAAGGGIVAFDPVDGELLWFHEGPDIERSGRFGYEAPIVADEFLLAPGPRAFHAISGPALVVDAPQTKQVVAGMDYEMEIELGNATQRTLEGVELEVQTPDVLRDVERSGVPDSIGPEETVTVTLAFTVEQLIDQDLPMEITASAETVSDTSVGTELEIRWPLEVSMVDSATDNVVLAENAGKFTFEVAGNEFELVEDVVLNPRFDRLDGEWTISNPLQDPDAIRHAGGMWEGTPEGLAGANAWLKPAMAPGGAEQPSLKMAIPDLPPGQYTLPIDAYVSRKSDGERIPAATFEFEIDTRYVFTNLEAPDDELAAEEARNYEVRLALLDRTVEDPSIAASVVPDEFEVVDGFGEGAEFDPEGTPSLEWSGAYDRSDDDLVGAFRIESPSPQRDVGGAYQIAVEGGGFVPEIDGTRRVSADDVVTVSGLPGKIAKKREKAARIDGVSRAIGEFDRVAAYTDALNNAAAADSSSVTVDAAEEALQRSYLAEDVIERALEITVPDDPDQAIDTPYNIIRPTAEGFMSLGAAAALNLFGAIGKILSYMTAIPPLPTLLNKANDYYQKAWDRAFSTVVTAIEGQAGDGPAELIEATLEDAADALPVVNADTVDQAAETLRLADRVAAADVSDALALQVDPLVNGMEKYMSITYEVITVHYLRGVISETSADGRAAQGFDGGRSAAVTAYSNGYGALNVRAEIAQKALDSFKVGVSTILKNMHENTAEIFTNITPESDEGDVWDLLELIKQSADAIITFLAGGALSAVIGSTALTSFAGVANRSTAAIVRGNTFSAPDL